MKANFSVATESLGDVRAVNVAGELDQATAPELAAALRELDGANGGVFLDLSSCEFIDSTGLSLLVDAHRRLSDDGGRGFAVCCPRTEVRRLLELTGIDSAVGLFESRDEAIASLDRSA